MRYARKAFFVTLICCATSISATAQAPPPKAALAANGQPVIDEDERIKRITSPEHLKDREALAFLVAEYNKRTGPWAPRADGLLKLPSKNFVDGYPIGFRVWPGNYPHDGEAWNDLLKSHGVPAEKLATRNAAPMGNVMVFISNKELYGFSVDPVRLNSSQDPTVRIVFERGFYCRAFVNNRDLPLIPNECFLDRWKSPGAKNARDEAELVYRLILMAGELYKFNKLRDDSVLRKIDGCFNGANPNKFREIREGIAGLNRDKQSGQVDEKAYSEKLAPLEKEMRGVASSGQTRSCAEFVFQYEYGAANAVYETAERLTACPESWRGCKDRKDFSRISLPRIMVQFLEYGKKKPALENYVRHMLPLWYPMVAALYGPMWDKYKTPR